LSAELRLEPVAPLSAERRAEIVAQATHELPKARTVAMSSRSRRWVRWLALTAGSAAVVTAIAVSLPRTRPQNISMQESKAIQALKQAVVTGREERDVRFQDNDKLAEKLDSVSQKEFVDKLAAVTATQPKGESLDDYSTFQSVKSGRVQGPATSVDGFVTSNELSEIPAGANSEQGRPSMKGKPGEKSPTAEPESSEAKSGGGEVPGGQPKSSQPNTTNGTASGSSNGKALPLARYIQNDVQYFPQGPEFRLSQQTKALEAYKARKKGETNGQGDSKPNKSDESQSQKPENSATQPSTQGRNANSNAGVAGNPSKGSNEGKSAGQVDSSRMIGSIRNRAGTNQTTISGLESDKSPSQGSRPSKPRSDAPAQPASDPAQPESRLSFGISSGTDSNVQSAPNLLPQRRGFSQLEAGKLAKSAVAGGDQKDGSRNPAALSIPGGTTELSRPLGTSSSKKGKQLHGEIASNSAAPGEKQGDSRSLFYDGEVGKKESGGQKDSKPGNLPAHAAAPLPEVKPSERNEKGLKQIDDSISAYDHLDIAVEKSDANGIVGLKKDEYAWAKYGRALEAERLRPGSVPLEELRRLERESETLGRQPRVQPDPSGAEAYQPIFENSFISPTQEPLSTFSVDVDSASYANMRRFLQNGQVPPPDAIRIEELVNYFAYQYPVPQDGKPFSVNADIAACPWSPGHNLVRIGLKGKEISKEQRPPSSLVFLVDVSGSMSAENKLPLVRSSLKTLVGQLDERDRIAIVTYAGEAGLRLPSTPLTQRERVLAAIDGLGAGGSTNGAAGINTAYDIAAKEVIEKGTNRVILCTDGDFNVGVTSNDALEQMIQTRAKSGVFLSVFGFGMGNLKDNRLEQLADKGNGQYGYIDDRQEADKVFVQELSGTLVTIAKDVKIQIDFNKDAVAAYRLVGYENRILATEDFHNDKKDAGEIGAGHTVTALYEIVPVKDLKPTEQTRWMTVKLRYKQPEASTSELLESPLMGQPGQLKLASSDFQFAAAVASFGMLLRNSQHAGQSNWGMVKELAQSGLSNDQYGHRSGFRRLIDQAESLLGERRPAAPPEPDSTANGKYKSLLRRLNVPEDAQKYGQYRDYGFDQTKAYGGAENLPEGYWVYVAPYWYIWGETTQAK
ncbi:MAG: von Willebrand factor related domain, partial [Planctomycetaceae bacterium]|nr:von Willebrand factor related domain [Planctomycetaceae bacterium]